MTSRTARHATSRRFGIAGLAVAALLAACDTQLPTASEIEHMDGAAIVATTAPMVSGDVTKVRFLVDGVEVTRDQAKALDAGVIASIRVVRAKGDAPGEVQIVTRAVRVTDATATTPAGSSGMIVVAAPPKARTNAPFEGLLVVDGKIVDASLLATIPPDQIASVDVLKGDAATSAYSDPRAAKGVIKVTTKAKP
jgi:hypothetical protein